MQDDNMGIGVTTFQLRLYNDHTQLSFIQLALDTKKGLAVPKGAQKHWK